MTRPTYIEDMILEIVVILVVLFLLGALIYYSAKFMVMLDIRLINYLR